MIDKLLKTFNSAAESVRGSSELGALYAFWPWLMWNTPAAPQRGKPVLVLPGLMTGDSMTAPLRQCLAQKGYEVHAWLGGTNLGLNPDTAAHLIQRLHDIYEQSGRRKVTLVGHSLGGIFARELARDYPHMVESVVTLGTPCGIDDTAAPGWLKQIYQWLNPKGDPDELTDAELQQRRLTPPPVPVTSIYSEDDGVVPWRTCLNPKAPQAENIKVASSHLGMIYHPLAVAAVLDRLAQDPAKWQPFNGRKYSWLYGEAANENDLPQNPQWQGRANSKPYFKKK